jgi:hypothetical protein
MMDRNNPMRTPKWDANAKARTRSEGRPLDLASASTSESANSLASCSQQGQREAHQSRREDNDKPTPEAGRKSAR